LDAPVAFLHKTVTDFLLQKEIDNQVRSYIPFQSFDPAVVLIASAIREIKALPIERAIIASSDRVMVNLYNGLAVAAHLEISHKRPYTAALDELDAVISRYWQGASEWKRFPSDPEWKSLVPGFAWLIEVAIVKYSAILVVSPLTYSDLDPFLTVSGCVLYVANKTLATRVTDNQRAALLGEFVRQFFKPSRRLEGEQAVAQGFNIVTACRQLVEQSTKADKILAMPVEIGAQQHWQDQHGVAQLIPQKSSHISLMPSHNPVAGGSP
jgi:hypothetical protein